MNDASRPPLVYKPQTKVRFVTAASLFDGHDASINIMRRNIQATEAAARLLPQIAAYQFKWCCSRHNSMRPLCCVKHFSFSSIQRKYAVACCGASHPP